MTYGHIYSHQDDQAKLLKIHDNRISMVEAVDIARNPSKVALLNSACDREAEEG